MASAHGLHESRSTRVPTTAVIAVVILAAALRLWNLGHGLPDILEEDYPFRRGLELWGWETGRTDWNPHFFIYPSLTLYLHFFLQHAAVAVGRLSGIYAVPADYRLAFATDPTPMLLLARAFQVACDLATVVGVMRLAERLRRGTAVFAGLLVALSPELVLTSRGIYCDTQMAALSVWALERLLAWRESGGRGRLAAAIALVGLAAGAKYPAGMLVIPLAWVILERRGRRGLLLAAAAVAAAFATFLVTTPYVLLDYAAFRRHFDYETEHMAAGHLGHVGQASFGAHLNTLAANLGWAGVAALVVSLALAFARGGLAERPARGAARALWTFILPLGLAFSLSSLPMQRYLEPVIAVGAVLAASAVFRACDRLGSRRTQAVVIAMAAMLVPVAIGGVRAASSGGRNTQAQARAWCEAHLGTHDLLVQEGYGAPLLTHDRQLEVAQEPWFRAAGAEAQQHFLARRAHAVVVLPLLTEGRPVVRVRTAEGGLADVEIFPFAADFIRVFYDPRLFTAVDYVLTSSAVRGRFEAEPARYARELDFYRFLDGEAEPVARFRPERSTVGPDIRIYRLSPAARATIAARHGELPLLWWAEMIPMPYRETVERLRPTPGAPNGGALRAADGRLSSWVRSLELVYQGRIAPFAQDMARELGRLGRLEMAERFASANLAVSPDDEESFRLLVICTFRREPLPRAKATIESTLVRLERQDPRASGLRQTYGRMLENLSRSNSGP